MSFAHEFRTCMPCPSVSVSADQFSTHGEFGRPLLESDLQTTDHLDRTKVSLQGSNVN